MAGSEKVLLSFVFIVRAPMLNRCWNVAFKVVCAHSVKHRWCYCGVVVVIFVVVVVVVVVAGMPAQVLIFGAR